MTMTVQKIPPEIEALPEQGFDQSLLWLADYELAHPGRWDQGLERDSLPGEKPDAILQRVRGDIAVGRV